MEHNARGEKKGGVRSDEHPNSPCMRFVALHPILCPPFPLNMPHRPGYPQSAMSLRTALKGEDHEVHWKAF